MKACPFCGDDDLGVGRGSTEDREGWPIYIYCGTCGAQGPWIYTRHNTLWTCTELACEETGWNKRVKEVAFDDVNVHHYARILGEEEK